MNILAPKTLYDDTTKKEEKKEKKNGSVIFSNSVSHMVSWFSISMEKGVVSRNRVKRKIVGAVKLQISHNSFGCKGDLC